jgi:hypothetical protein
MQPHILPQNGLYRAHGLYHELITPVINNPIMNNARSNHNFDLCREGGKWYSHIPYYELVDLVHLYETTKIILPTCNINHELSTNIMHSTQILRIQRLFAETKNPLFVLPWAITLCWFLCFPFMPLKKIRNHDELNNLDWILHKLQLWTNLKKQIRCGEAGASWQGEGVAKGKRIWIRVRGRAGGVPGEQDRRGHEAS